MSLSECERVFPTGCSALVRAFILSEPHQNISNSAQLMPDRSAVSYRDLSYEPGMKGIWHEMYPTAYLPGDHVSFARGVYLVTAMLASAS